MRSGLVIACLFSLCLGAVTAPLVSASDQPADGIPYFHGEESAITLSIMDKAAGENLYTEKGCKNCHGLRGFSEDPDMFPKIAGLDKQYIVEQLLAFQNGGRQNVIMSPVAAALTSDDIAALAAFVSAQH